MCPVAGSFQIARHSAYRTSPFDVSHTSSKSYGIGRNHSLFLALIAQHDHAVVIASFVELECSEINPCASSHLLVNPEFRNASVVEDKIFGIADTFRQGLVADVHRIFPFFRNVGNPFGKSFFRFGLGGNHACGTVGKRVMIVRIYGISLGKSGSRGVCPATFFIVYFQILASGRTGIVVHDDFLTLPVAFTRRKNNCTRIFKHGNQVRNNKRLGE